MTEPTRHTCIEPCERCTFAVLPQDSQSQGCWECRKNAPPTLAGYTRAQAVTQWPTTDGRGCGEHEPREPAEDDMSVEWREGDDT